MRRAAKKVDGTFENQRYSPAGLFRFVFALAAGMLVLGTSVANAADTAPQSAESATIDFNQDIRPILSNHCFACHGPDEEKRDSGLRLDTEEGLFEVVSRSDTDDSELWARVSSDDEEAQMPPPSFTMIRSKIFGAFFRKLFQIFWSFFHEFLVKLIVLGPEGVVKEGCFL